MCNKWELFAGIFKYGSFLSPTSEVHLLRYPHNTELWSFDKWKPFYAPWDQLIQSEQYLQNLFPVRKSGQECIFKKKRRPSHVLRWDSGGAGRKKLSPCISFSSLPSSGRPPAPLTWLMIVRVWDAHQFDVHFHQHSRSNAPQVEWKLHYVLIERILSLLISGVGGIQDTASFPFQYIAFKSLAAAEIHHFQQPKNSIISVWAFYHSWEGGGWEGDGREGELLLFIGRDFFFNGN